MFRFTGAAINEPETMNDDGKQGEGLQALLDRLTANERRCLHLVDKGLNSKEIARELSLSPHSVDTWLRSAARKLGVRTRFQAAKMLARAQESTETRGSAPVSTLRSQVSHIPVSGLSGESEASAGGGNGPDDLTPDRLLEPESHDSGQGRSWLEPSHPFARFFGGENRLPLGQRILIIAGIAIAISIAFTLVMNSFLSLSRLLESP